tara:strand:+ start:1879 stop:2106 length:228 start_codon:yes stop_codon:yes gene_type:complete
LLDVSLQFVRQETETVAKEIAWDTMDRHHGCQVQVCQQRVLEGDVQEELTVMLTTPTTVALDVHVYQMEYKATLD